MINRKAIVKVIGDLLLIETVLLLICAGTSFYYQDHITTAMLISALSTGVVGGCMSFFTRSNIGQVTRRDGYIMVTLSWLAFAAFGTLPFYLSGEVPSITNAFFESMSGITSTGATILDDIDNMPHGLLLWRSLTQWFGGLGIILFTIAILPFFGVNGLQMFAAEVSGPTHNKVIPRIGTTARWIWAIYAGLTTVLAVLLAAGGMSLFDSVCHALTTAGTGGFSTHQASIAYYNSPYIEYVIILFMFLSGINYSLLILFFTGKIRKVVADSELRWYTLLIITITAVVTVALVCTRDMNLEDAFRHSVFQVVSLQTSTGLSTADYATWPVWVNAVLLLVMVIGACAGSTSGGLKCIRIQVLIKAARNEFKHVLHPNAVLPVKINRQVVQPSLITTVMAFCFLYFAIIVVGTIALSAMGINFTESLGCSISALSNMGPALGTYGPSSTWNSMPDAGKWLMSLYMLLGRLEIFTVILLLTPDFWKRG